MADNNTITPTPENPIPDVDEVKPGIPTPAWADEGGGGLPAVTSQDAGKVLTVSDDGEWVAGSGGGGGTGGGVLVLHDNDGTFDKTWQEIVDAFDNGSIIVADYNTEVEGRSRAYLVGISIIHDDYVVIIRDFGDNVDVVYATNSASGYPTYTE